MCIVRIPSISSQRVTGAHALLSAKGYGRPRMATVPNAKVYMVPLIDVNWVAFGPLDPARGYIVEPPPVDQSARETERLCELMVSLVGGRFVLSPHSGTYNRIAFYEGDFVEIYQSAIAKGAEVSIHLHEEIKGGRTQYDDVEHMRKVFLDCKHALERAGIKPNSYRGGLYAYPSYFTSILEENGICIDFSCAPGVNEPSRHAVWPASALTGYYLPRESHGLSSDDQPLSNVFEIPIGADGSGAASQNFLFVERSDIQNLQRIWDAIVKRAELGDRPQIVHSLFHTSSIVFPEQVEKYQRFLDYARTHDGVVVKPSTAAWCFKR